MREWLRGEFAPHIEAWLSWRAKPRRSLWRVQGILLVLALVVPGFLLADGTQRALNLMENEQGMGRLLAVPLIAAGSVGVYVLWAHIRRPVLQQQEPEAHERKW